MACSGAAGRAAVVLVLPLLILLDAVAAYDVKDPAADHTAAAIELDEAGDGDGRALVELIKERWRQLALTAHPDVPTGSAERFLELRESYRMLLRVAKSRAAAAVV